MKRQGLKCGRCEDIIVSRSVHDFRTCKCGAVFVDGGGEYFRYGWTPNVPFEEVEVEM